MHEIHPEAGSRGKPGFSALFVILAWVFFAEGGVCAVHASPVRVDAGQWHSFEFERSAPARFEGPFRAQSMAFYLVHHGGPLRVRFTARKTGGRAWLLYRFYDAEDELVEINYRHFGQDGPEDGEFTINLGEAARGVYQLRYAARGSVLFDIRTEPQVSFGLLPLRSTTGLFEGAGPLRTAYVYIPPGSREYRGRPYGVRGAVYGADNRKIADLEHNRTSTLTVERADAVWRIELEEPVRGYRSSYGHAGTYDWILCPDPETARNLRGGLKAASDGRLFPHGFQARMWDWMKSLKPEDVKVEQRSLQDLKEGWLKEPVSSALLGTSRGAFTHVPYALQSQNLDPESPEYGGGETAVLALAYGFERPYNPYRGDAKLKNRVLLASFSRLIKLRANDTFSDSWDSYSGADALVFFPNEGFPYGMAAPGIPSGGIKDLWTEGIRRSIDRFPFFTVSCMNQTSHWPVNAYLVYKGSGMEVYREVSRELAHIMVSPELHSHMGAGYQQEAYGPDATYQGLGACYQAFYYKMTGDETVREGLRRIYDLFNHTAAPEPDGSIHGASNFSHRTEGSWAERQYGGGTLMMADTLPEAGLWHRNEGLTDENISRMRAHISEEIARTPPPLAQYRQRRDLRTCVHYSTSVWWFGQRYMYYPETVKAGELPMAAADRFERNFGNEFYAFRRPGYYALVYTGKPDPEWVRSRYRPPNPGKRQRLTGGGLSMFWTPGYGNHVLSMNWNAYTNQMVRADMPGGKFSWPDYWTLEHNYEPGAQRLSSTSRLIDLPVQVERRITFADRELRQEIRLTCTGSAEVLKAVEQVPYFKTGKESRILFLTAEGWVEAGKTPRLSRAAHFADDKGEGVGYIFDERVNLRLGEDTAGTGQSRGQLRGLMEIEITTSLEEGRTYGLGYRMAPAAMKELERVRF